MEAGPPTDRPLHYWRAAPVPPRHEVVRRENRRDCGLTQKPFTSAALRNQVRELLNGPPAAASAQLEQPQSSIEG
ncbi:MAG: hypothetical protein ABI765_14630 [Gemmatimonadota bacterium]